MRSSWVLGGTGEADDELLAQLAELDKQRAELLQRYGSRDYENQTTPPVRRVEPASTTPSPRPRAPPAKAEDEEDEAAPIFLVTQLIPFSLTTCQEDNVTMDDDGNFWSRGKKLSESAIEQRLRRFVEVKKSGKCKGGEILRKLFLQDRKAATDLFKECNLDKARISKCVIPFNLLRPLQTHSMEPVGHTLGGSKDLGHHEGRGKEQVQE